MLKSRERKSVVCTGLGLSAQGSGVRAAWLVVPLWASCETKEVTSAASSKGSQEDFQGLVHKRASGIMEEEPPINVRTGYCCFHWVL